MRKKTIILLFLTLITMLTISGCGKKEKTKVLTNNVKQQEAMKENEIKKFIKHGTDFLNSGKYDDAKSSFEKAILMDKSNKKSYIEIKNKYMEKDRLDDAYYFIKLAIGNNVDVENMEKILSSIKSKFQVNKLYISVYEKGEYSLPDKIKVKINNEEKEVSVIWNNENVDTSKIGTIKYEGKIEQYDRKVELYLKIIENKKKNNVEKDKKIEVKNNKVNKEKKIGFINEIYEQNGKRYLKFDDVQFFLNKDANDKTAEREAIKDGELKDQEVGMVPYQFYIRNKDKSLETYEISKNAYIYICGYRNNLNALDLKKVNYESFKNLGFHHESFLAHIYVENNVVVKIEEQFRP